MRNINNMSKSFKIFIAAAVMIAALTSCKSQFEALLNGSDVDAKYAAAFNYFNKGKYQKAAQLFESLSVLTNGTARDDTVQYYWGLSNYRYKDYYTAETNLSNFLTNFPNSPFAQDAAFLRIDCLYRSTYRYELDQNPTRNAIAVINQYLIDNPDSPHMTICENMLKNLNERLDKKAYENAKLYYNMEYYKAAWTAFKNILKDDADNIYREDILYYLAKSSYKYASMSVESKQKDRYLTFVDDYYNFIGEYPDSRNRKELSHYYDRAQKALGRYSGTEADLEVKEKDFSRDNEKNETIR